jgi:hypothetical protein
METGGGHAPQSFSPVSISLPTLCRVNPEFAERRSSIPRVRDVWIPRSEISPNHFIRLYMPGVEDLFTEGDRLYCNPTLAKCGGEAQHLEKLEVGSLSGLPNV